MRDVFNLLVLIAALAIGLLLTCGTMIYIVTARPAPGSDRAPANPALTLIPAPTSTAYVFTPTIDPLPPTPIPTASPAPGQYVIGGYVQITGTEGDGLRLRAEPGLDGTQLSLGYDSEIFQVGDGPRQEDGRVWWYLVSPYETDRAGWAVQDYLTPIENP